LLLTILATKPYPKEIISLKDPYYPNVQMKNRVQCY